MHIAGVLILKRTTRNVRRASSAVSISAKKPNNAKTKNHKTKAERKNTMKSQSRKTKAEAKAKAEAESQDRKHMERLLLSLTYLAGAILLSMLLIIGGLVQLALTAALDGAHGWAGLLSLVIGATGLVSIYTWALISRK
jgi:cation transport ATPase